jgi:antitoxin VapB
MAFSIRNGRVEKLARELARRTGMNMTKAIGEALDQRIRGLRSDAGSLKARLQAIAAECAAAPDLDTRTPEEILGYDENGAFADGRR